MAGFLLFMMGSQFLPPRDSTPAPINFDLLDEARSLDLIDMTLEFPEKLRGLEGRPVKLVGFMAPYDSLEDMRQNGGEEWPQLVAAGFPFVLHRT